MAMSPQDWSEYWQLGERYKRLSKAIAKAEKRLKDMADDQMELLREKMTTERE